MITLTPNMVLLISLLIDNAIKAIMNEVASMSPDEVATRIPVEEARKQQLLNELNSH